MSEIEITEIGEITEISTLEDVKKFFISLVIAELGWAFDPTYDFNDYKWESDNSQVFQKEEAGRLNKLMRDACKVCEINGTDVYKLTLDVMRKVYGISGKT